MALTWPQSREKGQFANLGANIDAIKYYCFDEIHIVGSKVNLKPNLVSFPFFSFHLFSFSSFVEFLCLFVNDGESF
jgi:hypothetical protein